MHKAFKLRLASRLRSAEDKPWRKIATLLEDEENSFIQCSNTSSRQEWKEYLLLDRQLAVRRVLGYDCTRGCNYYTSDNQS